ncbi:MAG: hypothetical protein JKY15_03015 [Deltaproteobacteria bacterium]|nr:hypothetical protein [Deltaproteobacteria bacterium]
MKSCIVSYQGGPGAYSELAAQKYFDTNSQISLKGFLSFEQALHALLTGKSNYAILPIENTITGPIENVPDLVKSTSVREIGSLWVSIEHHLIGLNGSTLSNIKQVYSHPQALEQCSEFLDSFQNCVAYHYEDTALAVKKLLQEENPMQAAIASKEAAELYGLKVLQTKIANKGDNQTRFVVLEKEPK